MNNCLKTNQPTSLLLPPHSGPDLNNKKARTCMTFLASPLTGAPGQKRRLVHQCSLLGRQGL